MKKLISAEDLENISNKGEKVLFIDKDTIVTPLAKDLAKELEIEITIKVQTSHDEIDEINDDMIYKVIKVMKEKGLLEEFLDLLNKKPYIIDEGPEGLKVIRGSSIEFNSFDTGNPQDKVFYQELISKDDSLFNVGLLTIEDSSFDQKLIEEVAVYVIEGTLSITINGETLTANPGDVVHIPLSSKVTLGSSSITKLFYVKS